MHAYMYICHIEIYIPIYVSHICEMCIFIYALCTICVYACIYTIINYLLVF